MKKKHKLLFGPVVLGLCALPVNDSLAAIDAFLKVAGVPGESMDSKHRGEIDIITFQHFVPQNGVGVPDFKFTMSVNKASPILYACCAGGTNITSMMLTLRKAGTTQLEFMRYYLEGVTVTGVQVAGSASSDTVPLDEFTVKFRKITWTYVPQNLDGSAGTPVTTSWTDSTILLTE